MGTPDGSQRETPVRPSLETGFARVEDHSGQTDPLVLSGTGSPPSQSYCQEWCDRAAVEHPHCCLPAGSRPGPRPQECQARPASALPTCPGTRAARAERLSSQSEALGHQQARYVGPGRRSRGSERETRSLPWLGSSLEGSLHTHPTLTPSLPPVRATNCVCVC